MRRTATQSGVALLALLSTGFSQVERGPPEDPPPARSEERPEGDTAPAEPATPAPSAPAREDETKRQPWDDDEQDDRLDVQARATTTGMVRASQLRGLELRDTSGQWLGTIEDVLIAPASGQVIVQYALLRVDGLGRNELVILPWDLLQPPYAAWSAEGYLILHIPRERLLEAPTVSLSDLGKADWIEGPLLTSQVEAFFSAERDRLGSPTPVPVDAEFENTFPVPATSRAAIREVSPGADAPSTPGGRTAPRLERRIIRTVPGVDNRFPGVRTPVIQAPGVVPGVQAPGTRVPPPGAPGLGTRFPRTGPPGSVGPGTPSPATGPPGTPGPGTPGGPGTGLPGTSGSGTQGSSTSPAPSGTGGTGTSGTQR